MRMALVLCIIVAATPCCNYGKASDSADELLAEAKKNTLPIWKQLCRNQNSMSFTVETNTRQKNRSVWSETRSVWTKNIRNGMLLSEAEIFANGSADATAHCNGQRYVFSISRNSKAPDWLIKSVTPNTELGVAPQ